MTTEVGVGMNDRKYNFIDLFAGAGGLSEGFISQGDFVPVAHVEMNKYASVFRKRICSRSEERRVGKECAA